MFAILGKGVVHRRREVFALFPGHFSLMLTNGDMATVASSPVITEMVCRKSAVTAGKSPAGAGAEQTQAQLGAPHSERSASGFCGARRGLPHPNPPGPAVGALTVEPDLGATAGSEAFVPSQKQVPGWPPAPSRPAGSRALRACV